MRTINRFIGELVGHVIATFDEIRVAHFPEGAKILVRDGMDEYTQFLPLSLENNPEGYWKDINRGLILLNKALRANKDKEVPTKTRYRYGLSYEEILGLVKRYPEYKVTAMVNFGHAFDVDYLQPNQWADAVYVNHEKKTITALYL